MFNMMFFTEVRTLKSLLTEMNRIRPLLATKLSFTDSPEVSVYGVDDIPPLSGDAALSELNSQYLIGSSCQFRVEPVAQKRGGVKYSVGPLENPEACVLVTGGEPIQNVFVPGQVWGPMAGFGAFVKKHFRSLVRGYYKKDVFAISPEIYDRARNGARLVTSGNPLSPIQFDLKIS